MENGGVERYKQLRELIKNADTLSEADARPMPSFMNMQKDGIRRYSDENSRIAVMKNGDTFRLYDYDLRTVSKELTRSEVNAALREYNTKKNAVTSMNQQNMQVTENMSENITAEEINNGIETAEFIETVNQMLDESKRTKRKKRIGVISKNHADAINKLMQKINPGFSAEGYEIWIDGTSAQHIEKRHGKNGKADKTMASKEAKALIPWAAQNADSGEFIRNKNGEIKRSDRFFNSDGTKAPEIKLKKTTPDGDIYVSECVPDSTNKRIWITSAYINKNGSKGQLLNIEDNSSPQPTPEASFDSNATTNSIPQNAEKVNTSTEKNISKSQTAPKSAAELDSIAKENIPEYSKLSLPTRVMIRKVLYDALASGYSEYDAVMFARVSARSGLHMTFSKSLCLAGRIKGTKDLVHADGYYDPYGNRIVIAEESRTHTVLRGKYPHLLKIKYLQYLILLRIFSLHLHNICSLKTAEHP